ncbi:MAG: glycosyltransferase family 9 protein [bacterium]
MRTLVVRDDRIGDLVLTLPAIEALARAGDAITLVASAANADLVAHDRRIASTVVLPEGGKARLRAFAGLVRRGRFDRAFFFRSRWPRGWIAAALGVPARIGPFANADGLAYTIRPRQHRSGSGDSEATYSLELLELAGVVGARTGAAPEALYRNVVLPERVADLWLAPPPAARLALPEALRERARRWIQDTLAAGERSRPRVVVHPGAGGSSRNWSAARFRSLVRELSRHRDVTVIVTGAPHEVALAREVAAGSTPAAPVHIGWAGPLAHAALLGEVAVVVSGSTGTMHLAAAVGTATVSLFAPIRASSPVRWGALSARARFALPPVPDCERCIGPRCPWWDCMDRIGMERVESLVRAALAEGAGG